MDGSRFDAVIRALAAGQTRRRTLQGLTSGALAGLIGFAGLEDATAGCVKPGKRGCKGPKNGKCCPGARCQGGTKDKEGKCKCKGSLKQCGTKCVNTKTDKNNCGRCNTKCAAELTCKRGTCTSKLGCRAGHSVCEGGFVACPDDPSCFCVTDVSGIPYCSDLSSGFCVDCTTNGDCAPHEVCVSGDLTDCGCATNSCVSATCKGL